MDAKELRIGNWVRAKSPEKKEWVDRHKISANTIYSMEYPTAMDFVKPDMEPIPITEEWLLDFGFEKKGDYYERWSGDLLYSYEDGWGLTFGQGMGFSFEIKCDYVHQLQNLYFALTGEELELKK